MAETGTDIAANLSAVRGAVDVAAKAGGSAPENVTLIAVSKTQPAEEIERAIEAGQRVFGENRIQEAQAKWPDLKARYPDVVLHLIGGVQTNKVKAALDMFDVIHTLDRPKLAAALAREGEKLGRLPTCFIQVNTGEEPQKGGVLPAEADGFIKACRTEYGLPVAGLMCIPPADEEPALHFALLKKIAQRNGLDGLSMGLSMGMSGDFELAVEMGATHIRVGTAIFGPRRVSA